jgi:hypothetical protein
MPDWDRIRRAKDAYRAQLATLPLPEKLAIVERLRERAVILRGERQSPTTIHRVLASGVQLSGPSSSATSAGGTINLGVFGASPSLFIGVTAERTSASTVTSGQHTENK